MFHPIIFFLSLSFPGPLLLLPSAQNPSLPCYRSSLYFSHSSPPYTNAVVKVDPISFTTYSGIGLATTWPTQEECSFNSALYKSIHGSASIPTDHLRQPSRHTRQCGTDTFTPLSFRTSAYKYSFFPRTVTDWNALPDPVRSAPSTESFRAALRRSPTSTSSSCC